MAEPDRSTEAAATSLLGGLKGWLHDGTELLRVRLELFSVEAREHALGLVQVLVLGVAAVLLLGMGVAFFAVLLTVLLWDSHRTLVLGVFTAIFLSVGAGAVVAARQVLQRQRQWFASSARELARDAERLRS